MVFFFLLFYAQTSLLTVLELKHTRFVRARADLIHAHARRVNDFAIDRERDVTGVRGGRRERVRNTPARARRRKRRLRISAYISFTVWRSRSDRSRRRPLEATKSNFRVGQTKKVCRARVPTRTNAQEGCCGGRARLRVRKSNWPANEREFTSSRRSGTGNKKKKEKE